ncbi:MAG: magnesium transporter [Desulfurococcales archaeon]|nr:magnesium transporter [Desulfurococcales archaeon]
MARVLVYFEALDRPGLLSGLARSVAEAGGNIVASLAFVRDSTGHVVLLVDFPGEPDVVGERVRSVSEKLGGSVEIAEPGPEAAAILARLFEVAPEASIALIPYMGAADVVDALMRLDEASARRVIGILPPRLLAEVLLSADEDSLKRIASWSSPQRLARALRELSPDDAAEVLGRLEPQTARRVLDLLPPEYRVRGVEVLAYPHGSVASIMTTSFPRIASNSTVAEALRELGKPGYEVRDVVVIVDSERGIFVGMVDAGDLISADPGRRIASIAKSPPITASPSDDAEEVARAMVRYRLRRVPVVAEDGRLVGLVAIEDVARLLAEESAEDLAKIAGSGVVVDRYVPASALDLFKARIPPLVVVLLIEALAAMVIKRYEGVIRGAAVLAAFLPLIMAAGGGSGTQSVGLVLRAMALGEVSERRLGDYILVLGKELRVGSIMSITLAVFSAAVAWILGAPPIVVAIIACSLALAVLSAEVVGAVLPMIARRLGLDPASVSTPLITTLVDVGVSALYLTLAALLLSG